MRVGGFGGVNPDSAVHRTNSRHYSQLWCSQWPIRLPVPAMYCLKSANRRLTLLLTKTVLVSVTHFGIPAVGLRDSAPFSLT